MCIPGAPDIGFRSYDRFFPSRDTLPQGGFGNLIALPLQGGPRESGNSVFLDADFEPWPDQWSFLSGLRRLSATELATIVDEAGRRGRIVGLRLPIDDEEEEEPWTAPPSRRRPLPAIGGALPARIGAVLGDQLYVAREGLPRGLVNRLVRLAAFQNPAFYAAQAMRRSTFGTPRIVACAELLSHHIALPRGCLAAMEGLLEEQRPFSHRALLRPTAFRLPAGTEPERPPIQHVCAALAEDAVRDDMIFDDVLSALEAGRSPLVLTARKDHAERLGRFARNVLFHGGDPTESASTRLTFRSSPRPSSTTV